MKKFTAMKNYFVARKTRFLVCALIVTTTAAVLNQASVNQHDEFLKHHQLYSEYYSLDEK